MGRAAGEKDRRLTPPAFSFSGLTLSPGFRVLDQALDPAAVLGGTEANVLDRATESHIVAQVLRTVGVGQKIIDVDLANLVMAGCIATVVRLVALGH
jgi:hypothetical protein